jgi:hypothetical protein
MIATRRRSSVRRSFRRPHRPQRLRVRLQVEGLEDRLVLSTGPIPIGPPVPPAFLAVPGQFSQPVAGTPTGGTTAGPGFAAPQGTAGQQAQTNLVPAREAPTAALQQNQLASQTNRLAFSPENQQLLAAAEPILLQGLPMLSNETVGTLRLAPATPPPFNVERPQLILGTPGLPPSGTLNRAPVNTALLEVALTGGGVPSLLETPVTEQPTHRPANDRVFPAPADEPQEQAPAPPSAAPAAGQNVKAVPILLAPASGPERLPAWDLGAAAAAEPAAARPVKPARPVGRAKPAARLTPAEPAASLWGRMVSLACFAAGALGAAWFPDVRDLGTKRTPLTLPREGRPRSGEKAVA